MWLFPLGTYFTCSLGLILFTKLPQQNHVFSDKGHKLLLNFKENFTNVTLPYSDGFGVMASTQSSFFLSLWSLMVFFSIVICSLVSSSYKQLFPQYSNIPLESYIFLSDPVVRDLVHVNLELLRSLNSKIYLIVHHLFLGFPPYFFRL